MIPQTSPTDTDFGFNRTHPEKKTGEVFIGNFTGRVAEFCRWKTKRVGNVSYDVTGIPVADCVPVFMQNLEAIENGIIYTQPVL